MTEKQRVTGNALVQPRALKTREKIILAAISVYSEKGYYNTTVDEIAKSAGLSVGTAYRYFKDKKELLLEALKYGFEHITEFADVSEDTDVEVEQVKSIVAGNLSKYVYVSDDKTTNPNEIMQKAVILIKMSAGFMMILRNRL